MRRTRLLLTALTLATLLQGLDLSAQPTQEVLLARKQAALKKPFVQNADWITDFAAAKAAAQKASKPILVYFSRSYWP